MKIQVPEKVEFILNKLMENGYEAYAVGGCVRDSILHRVPGDWDITTSASPYEVKEIFRRTIDTGIQHGTVTVMLEKEGFEVTTYRLDGEYEDCRHPKKVEFTKSLEEDLKRRDFTINAMAYNDTEGMVDLFEGLEDIKRKRIRCVGSAMDRFEEDALRILRAVRFSAQLDFEIEDLTREAICNKAKNLANISAERIREELNKLFLSKHPDHLMIAYETNITGVVLPEFDASNQKELIISRLLQLAKISDESLELFDPKSSEFKTRKLTSKERLCLAYAIVLGPSEEAEEVKDSLDSLTETWEGASKKLEQRAKQVLRRLKFDNDTIHTVARLLLFHNLTVEETRVSIRKAMNCIGTEFMDLWFLLQQLEVLGELNLKPQEESLEVRKQHLAELHKHYQASVHAKECVNLKMLAVTGKDLIGIGYQPGAQLGTTLNELLQHVLEVPEDNTQEQLLKLANS